MHARHAILAALSAALAAAPVAAHAAPRYSVTITRTAQGLPHVVAKDMGSLGYGSGYAAAEDNGCVVADTLLTVRGERSRFLGASARVIVGFAEIANLESDFFHRIAGDLPRLRRAFAATSRDNRALIEGFAAGYNRFLRDAPQRFAASCRGAAWLSPMRRDDALLLVNAAMVQGSAAPFARFISSAAPPGPAAAAPIAAELRLPDPIARQGLGSNGWAFGSGTTAGGRGLLVGNPHFPWNGPNRFRRLHLTIPGKLDVMGAALTHSPFVAIGFNKDVAWTHTVSTAQHHTLYELALAPDDATAYLVDGRPEPMQRRELTVEVGDGPPVTRTLYATRYGPAIAIPGSGLGWTAAKAYAIRDANQANFRSGDAWLGIARARSVEGIRDVVGRTLGIPYVNTLAVDRAGRTLYADVSPVPNLSFDKLADCAVAEGSTPSGENAAFYILDGARAACAWEVDRTTPVPGLMPPARLPALVRTDWLQNANDSYWLSHPDAPMPAYSPVLGPHAARQGMRTRSAIRVLRAALAAGRIDMDLAKRLAFENRVHAAELVLDDLLALCPARPALAPACDALARWDRRAENGSKGALLFFSFWRKANGIRNLWAVPFDPADPAGTPRTLAAAAGPAILDALQGAVDELGRFKVPLDAPLGLFQVSPRGAERIAIHGGPSAAGVLNAMHSAPAPEGLIPFHGTSYLFVVTWDDRGPVAESILSYSQSSDPESPWFADGTRDYSAKRWMRLPFTPAQIAAARVGEPLTIGE